MNDIFSTKNLFIASFLMASGELDFCGMRSLDPKTKLFTFKPADRARELETEYFSGAAISAKMLFAEYNTLKDMLFQRETNGRNYGRSD